jgi:hypothetical protein
VAFGEGEGVGLGEGEAGGRVEVTGGNGGAKAALTAMVLFSFKSSTSKRRPSCTSPTLLRVAMGSV